MITVKMLREALKEADDAAVIFISDCEDIYLADTATTAAIVDDKGPVPAVIFSRCGLPISKQAGVSLYKDIAST